MPCYQRPYCRDQRWGEADFIKWGLRRGADTTYKTIYECHSYRGDEVGSGEYRTCQSEVGGPCSARPNWTAHYMNNKGKVIMEIPEEGETNEYGLEGKREDHHGRRRR